MTKRVRWVVYETPVFVRVEYDDAYEGEDVTKVIVVDEIADMRPMREPVSGMPVVLDENFKQLQDGDRTAVSTASALSLWPKGQMIITGKGWDHGPNPCRDPDWYLDMDDDVDDAANEDPEGQNYGDEW